MILRPRIAMDRVAASLLTLCLASPALAREPERASAPRHLQAAVVLDLLRAPHPDVDRQRLDRIGPDVAAVLVEHATSPKLESAPRLRALGWLHLYPSASTKAVLREVIHARDPDTATLRVAVRALAKAFPLDSLPVVRAHLQHKDAYVREAAAYALGDLQDPRARDVIADLLQREPELFVRDAAMASLHKLGARTTKSESRTLSQRNAKN
jgi:hypothetical protein